MRLLALHDIEGLADAEPDTMRFRLYHLPACLPASPTTPDADGCASMRPGTWPWAEAFTTCWQRLTNLAAVT